MDVDPFDMSKPIALLDRLRKVAPGYSRVILDYELKEAAAPDETITPTKRKRYVVDWLLLSTRYPDGTYSFQASRVRGIPGVVFKRLPLPEGQ